MTQFMQLDERDKAALVALASFEIDVRGEVATVVGEMEIEIVRAADDGGARLRLTIQFPKQKFSIWLSRAKTLEQLDVKDES